MLCAHRFCQYVANFLLMPLMNKKVFYADQRYGWLKHGVSCRMDSAIMIILNNLNRICEPPCFEPRELCCAAWTSSWMNMCKLFNFAFYDDAGEMLVPEEHYGQALSRVLRSFCKTFRMLEGNTQKPPFSIPSSIPRIRIAICSFNFFFPRIWLSCFILLVRCFCFSLTCMLLLFKYQECFFFFLWKC